MSFRKRGPVKLKWSHFIGQLGGRNKVYSWSLLSHKL